MKTAKDLVHLQDGKDGRIFVEYIEDVAIIKMDRGENRMNDQFIAGINAALDEILQKPHVKAVITTGTGKFYSNGLDLNWLNELSQHDPDHIVGFVKSWQTMMTRVLQLPLITVAAINGHAYAGGAIFTLAHDLRIMNDQRGWWSANEVHINLRFSPLLLELIKLRVTASRALTEAMIFGKQLIAKEALNLGVVDETSAPGDLLKAAQTLALKQLPKQGSISLESLSNMKKDFFSNITALLDNFSPGSNFVKPKL